jgi:hypothetical protein
MTIRRSLMFLAVVGFVVTASAGAALAFFAIPTAYAPASYSVATASSLEAPTVPSTSADGPSAITVGWTPASGQLAGAQYRVTRSTGPGSPITVCTVAASTTSCQDTGLTAGSTYGYSITAVLGAWQSSAITTSASTSKAAQTISFTSTAPSNATANGATYTVTASATSGLTVTFTTDPTSTGCSIAGSIVSFTSAGTCKINANQVGDSQHLAAPQVQQSFAVTAPAAAGMIWTNVRVGSSSVTPTCTGTIGSTWSCTVSGGNNATVTANVTFANAAGTATAFSSSQGSTLNVTTTGKSGATSTTTIAAGQTTSTGTVSAQKSGSNAASITVTFNGWTAVLTIS